jgi:hypothetical protein
MSIKFAVVRNDEGDAAHVHLVGREHDTDGRDCWCGPTFYLVCDECDDGCWKCDDGKIKLTPEQAAASDEPLLIVHQA